MFRTCFIAATFTFTFACGSVEEPGQPDGGSGIDGASSEDPVLEISDVTAVEGHYLTPIEVEVTLSAAAEEEVTVGFMTSEMTATTPEDFASDSGVLAFSAGETSKTIELSIVGDRLSEQDEQFSVELLSATGAAIGRGQATVTIADDDGGGDLNDDGFADLVVGVQSLGQGDDGAVYFFSGGDPPASAPPTSSAPTLTPESTGDRLGVDVVAADVNGDGVDDAVVTARNHDDGKGAIYIFYGPGLPDGSVLDADVKILGDAAGDNFGIRLAAADVTGDGIDDLLASARNRSQSAGAVYVIEGSPDLPPQDTAGDLARAILVGEEAGDAFGTAVSTAGDQNGDGVEDILVSANGNDRAGENAGAAYVFFSDDQLTGTVDAVAAEVTFVGAAAGDFLGRDVAGGVDIDGEGGEDLLIGSQHQGGGNGAAYLFLGKNLPSFASADDADLVITSSETDAALGFDVELFGDATGGGVPDLAIGARFGGAEDQGELYIFSGEGIFAGGIPDELTADDADMTIQGESGGDFLGAYITTPIDLDGDGIHDLTTAADGSGGSNVSNVYVFLEGAPFPSTGSGADVVIDAESGSFLGDGLQ